MGAGLARLADWGTCMPSPARHFSAGLTMFAEMGLTHHRPQFGINVVAANNRSVAVAEEAADDTPFGTLLHFRKDHAVPQPRVLLVAPMSGHFATLLRGTVQVMLRSMTSTSPTGRTRGTCLWPMGASASTSSSIISSAFFA